jgi:hypothetical protein
MFCPKCGKQVDESDAFCRSCGHTLSTEKANTTGLAPASGGAGTVAVGKAIEPTRTGSDAVAIIRVVVLLFVLGFVISQRDWIRDAADNIGGYDDALKQMRADAAEASREAFLSGAGTPQEEENQLPTLKSQKATREEMHARKAKARGDARHGTGGGEEAEPGAEPAKAVQARGYKDDDGMYRARREDDIEAQYQFDRINEDLIAYLPMCENADSALKTEIDKSLRLDEYELSRLIGRDEAKAFHTRAVEQGCL